MNVENMNFGSNRKRFVRGGMNVPLFFSFTWQQEQGRSYYLQNCILLRPQQAVAEDVVEGGMIRNRGKKETKNEILSILFLVQYGNEPRNNKLAEV
jgi:hypothetical protein